MMTDQTRLRFVVAANVRARRAYLRMNQQDLADSVGVTKSGLSKWESGAVDIGADAIDRLAKALGLDAQTLCTPHGTFAAAS